MKQARDLFPGHILEDEGADRILRSNIGNYLCMYGTEMMRDFLDPDFIFGEISDGVFKYYVFPKGDEESENKDCQHDIIEELKSRGYTLDIQNNDIYYIGFPKTYLSIYPEKKQGQYKIFWGTLAWKDCTFKKKDSRKIADRLIAFDKTVPAMKEATKIIADYLAKYMKQKEIIASALCALGEADGGEVSNIRFSPGTKDEVEYTLYKGESFQRLKCQWKDIFNRAKGNLPQFKEGPASERNHQSPL